MQNLIDLFAAGFIFLLFASVFRKRNTAAVRFWLTGWFFVLLHFGSLAWLAYAKHLVDLLSFAALGTLVLCAVAFVLSREEAHADKRRQITIACLLGLPWLATMALGSLPSTPFAAMAVCAYGGAGSICYVGLRWFGARKLQFACILLVALGCVLWLNAGLRTHDPGVLVAVVLTQCFGLNAVLLSFGHRRFSAATATTSVGAVAWALVWVAGTLVGHIAPAVVVNPEIWNLPKYVIAAGMILTLLEEEIRSAELASEHYRLLFAGNPHPMWMYDPATLRFLQVNEAAMAHYGFTQDEFRAMTLPDLVSEEDNPNLIQKLRAGRPQQLSGPWLHRRRDGSAVQVDMASQPVLQGGSPIMFALMHDVTERQHLHAQLLRQAHHDPLTDLPNRVLFEQRLDEALAAGSRDSSKVAVFCFDLDRFKQINDSFGHGAGDLCLKEAAARITGCLGGEGTLARSGGDEFMLVMGDLKHAEDAEVLASTLLGQLRRPVQLAAGDVELGASVGFAVFPDDGETAAQLWRDADAAMYRAKRAGGGQWVRVSSEISNAANQANEIELGLRRALKAGDLELHYQPQMTIDGRLHSFEALFRSRDAALRAVSADRLIAIAEESGLIVPLGNWVLEAACNRCRAWMDAGLGAVQIAVNVSPLQLTRFDFARQVAKVLDRYRLNPRMLEFEVTESTMMPDRGGDAQHQIATLARMGIRFSVDDFGKGYSSLGRLHQLPVDSLKVDRSFTQRIGEFNGTYATVEAIIGLAHTLGMKVIAEGVEEEGQLHLLRSLGCDRVQGYLFSQPLPADQATGFLESLEDREPHAVVA